MKDVSHDTILSVDNLTVHFPMPSRAEPMRVLRAVDGVSFDITAGTTFGIVGESGSGKSTTAMSVMRLASMTNGTINFNGQDISQLHGNALRQVRRHLQLIFQDPYSSLDPRRRINAIIREPLDRLSIGSRAEREERVGELLQLVGLRPDQAMLYPHQFSGGQRQRVNIARALATSPKLIVCDEPVSALDVAIQAQVLNLLKRLQNQLGLTYLFISHDLGVVQHMCDEIAVMYLGRIVERASRRDLFNAPQHPYTRTLLASVPSINNVGTTKRIQKPLIGEAPSPLNLPSGCPFQTRCSHTSAKCGSDIPLLDRWRGTHFVACHHVGLAAA